MDSKLSKLDINSEQLKELVKMCESYEKLDKKTREEIIKQGFLPK
jgi:hypothetical protein